MTEQPRDLRDDGELMSDDAPPSAADDLDPDSDDWSGTGDGTSLGSEAVESDPELQDGSAGRDALLGDDADFTRRWDQAQATFVDDPRRAVSEAAALVEDVLARLSDTFSAERERAEANVQDGEETENLRVAMQQYREFFRRLLAA
jgi:hypothetical protein